MDRHPLHSDVTNVLSGHAFASLFSGIGGLDFGFHEAGMETQLTCDNDPWACRSYAGYFGAETNAHSIEHVIPKDIDGVDMILAGPPCQGFSSLGRQDANDPRNDLFSQTAALIAAARPTLFVIENVSGLAWVADGAFLRDALTTLRRSGLEAEVFTIDCARLGVPQRRKRLLVLGGRARHGRAFQSSIRSLLAAPPPPPVTVRDTLLPVPTPGTLPNHHVPRHRTQWYDEVIPHIGEGQKLCDTRLAPSSIHSWDIPKVFGRTTRFERTLLAAIATLRRSECNRPFSHVGDGRPVRLVDVADHLTASVPTVRKATDRLVQKGYVSQPTRSTLDLTRRFNGRFKRLPLDLPAPAVVREFAHARNVLHPTQPRALTVRECARLQTFPDTFILHGPLRAQYSQVANAFPPAASRHIAACAATALSVRRRR